MGKFKLDKTGIRKIQKMLEGQVANVEKELAITAFDYFVRFGYHAKYAPQPFESNDGGGWTCYYAANWNCAVNGIDSSILSPVRVWYNDERKKAVAYHRDKSYCEKIVSNIKCGDSITVTNSADYGKWLNDGGYMERTYNKHSHANRFMEQCQAYVESNIQKTIEKIRKECPDL